MSRKIETKAVHAGAGANPTSAVSMPIFQTSIFRLGTCADGAEICSQIAPAELYTRWGNPTTAAMEAAVAELESAEGAMAFASGMGAVSAAVLSRVRAGDHVLAQRNLYGGTVELLGQFLAQMGAQTTFADAGDFAELVQDNTTLIYVETPANPATEVVDLEAVAAIGRARGVFTICDNTWASPINQRPIELGIDGVVHSATKYLGGHSDVISGVVAGPREWLESVWRYLKILGACPSPHDAWLVLRGLKTLAVRVRQQNDNAMQIAEVLDAHPAVAAVHYPGLAHHPGHAIARRQMHGFGGMIAFDLAGGLSAGRKLLDGFELITQAVSLGGTETLAVHPASTSHACLTDAQREAAGIGPGLIRMSVGIEAAEDLIVDLVAGLDRLSG